MMPLNGTSLKTIIDVFAGATKDGLDSSIILEVPSEPLGGCYTGPYLRIVPGDEHDDFKLGKHAISRISACGGLFVDKSEWVKADEDAFDFIALDGDAWI